MDLYFGIAWGSHPDTKTPKWYVCCWVARSEDEAMGFLYRRSEQNNGFKMAVGKQYRVWTVGELLSYSEKDEREQCQP